MLQPSSSGREFSIRCPVAGLGCEQDSDGDEFIDPCDNCPAISNTDQADTDNDEVGDVCPGGNDSAPGALDDDDGDGVINCNDRCPGADDSIFAP